MKRYLLILLLTFNASLVVASPLKKVAADTTVDKNTLKKILHWVSAFTMYSSVDLSDKVDLGQYAEATDLLQSFVQNPELSLRLNAFRKATFVNVYPKGLLNGNEWILKKLNEIADAQYSTLNPPSLTLEVWFTPDATASRYLVTALFKTTEDKLRAAVAAANPALSSALLGKTYAQPRLAKADVNAAIFAALDALQTAIGSTFAPNIAIRYNDVMYLNNQTIEVWQKANEGITLQAVDKNNVLLTGALTWTNVVGTGNTIKFPIGKVGLERVTLKRGSEAPISLLMKVKEFNLDLNSLLKKLIIEALSAKKKKATDTLVALRQDSLRNANDIGRLITELEKNNFPLENTGASLTPLFANPVTLIAKADTSIFANTNSTHAKSFAEIRKRKRIHKTMRHSINVAAVADLIVTDHSRMNTLLDDLVKNSGELIANLILGKDSKGQEDIAKSIVIDYLNKNLERITGEAANDMQADPPLPLAPPAPPAAAPTFVATKYLYISSQVQFAGRDAFIKQLEDSLQKRKTYAFINYSQDVSTEAYLSRTKGVRPKGLPQDAKFVTISLVNIPGSVKYQVFGSKDGTRSGANDDIVEVLKDYLKVDDSNQTDLLLSYWQEKARQIHDATGKNVIGIVFCRECKNATKALQEKNLSNDLVEITLPNQRCLLSKFYYDGITFKVENSTSFSNKDLFVKEPNAAFETTGKYDAKGQALVVVFRDKPSGYCTKYLENSIADICTDGFRPDQNDAFLNSIYKSVAQCLQEQGIFKPEPTSVSSVLNHPLVSNEKINAAFTNLEGKENTIQSPSLPANEEAQYTVTIAKTGKVTIKISESYLRSLGARVPPSVWDELQRSMEKLLEDAALKLCNRGSGPDCIAKQLNLLQVLNLNLRSLATNNTIDPAMWNDGGVRENLPTWAQWEAPGGGLVDGLVEESVGIVILVKTVGEIAIDTEKQKQIVKIFTREGITKLGESILEDLFKTLTDPKKRSYAVTKTGVAVVFLFYSLTSEAGKKLDDVLRKAEDLANKIDNAPNLRKQLTKVTEAKDVSKIDRLSKLIDELGAEDLEKMLAKVDESSIENLLEDIHSTPALKNAFKGTPELVDSWKIVKDAPEAVRKNTSVLENISSLSAKTLNGNPLNVQKLFDNGLSSTLSKVSDADKVKILDRINQWDASKVDDLARRLGKDNYPALADDLADPDFFKLYDDIIHDPENALDIAKRAGNGNLTTTAKSTFFNDVTKLGKDFEGVVAPALKPGGALRSKLKTILESKFGIKDLDSYQMFEQVQFTYNKSGDYFIADQAFVKYGFDTDGDKFIESVIIIENKLSDATKLTGNQSAARSIAEYTVRSRQISGLEQGLNATSNKWLRVYGDGSGKNIVDITDDFK